MWDVVKDGVMHDGRKRKTAGQASAMALSSGQETATVSAVSLMANKLPEGVVAACECVLDESFWMRGM